MNKLIQEIYHDILTRLRDENEQLLAINDALNLDLDHAHETIEMYEDQIDEKFENDLDATLNEMLADARGE